MNNRLYNSFVIFGIFLNMCIIVFIVKIKLGKTNIKGYAGLRGPDGDIGIIGPQGIQGLQGNDGFTGTKGPKGEPGREIHLNSCRDITENDHLNIERTNWRWRDWCPNDSGCRRSLANKKVCSQVNETLQQAYCRFYPLRDDCTNRNQRAKYILEPGETLGSGQTIYSPGKNFRLSMQADGNLVIYGPNTIKGISNTAGNNGAVTIMQNDCNLVTYNNSVALWGSNTVRSGGNCRAKLGNDGILSIYQGDTELWRK